MKIYDLQNCSKSNRDGIYGGNSGSKEGIVFDGARWIVKYPKSYPQSIQKLSVDKERSYNTSPVSEYIGSHIYHILGIPVHETILGFRNNRIVVACKDLCDDNHQLIEFRQSKNVFNQELNEKLDESFSSTQSSLHFTSLKAIMLHLDYNPAFTCIPKMKDRFWDCVVIDGFINNNDRNNGNWGLLRGPEGDTLSPVYDNGASFSPNIPEEKLVKRLRDDNILVQSATSIRTAYTLGGNTAAFFSQILKQDIPELNDAILRIVPKIKDKLPEMEEMILEIPERGFGHSVLSPIRNEEYRKELEVRYEKILLPQYNKLMGEGRELGNDSKDEYGEER